MNPHPSSEIDHTITRGIASGLNVHPRQVVAATALLDGGATVPFIARYRKEATGGLDDNQLRDLEEQLRYGRELEERRATILRSVADQGKLSPGLEAELKAADSKTRLEDLYLPYRPKHRTKAQLARESGLEPLALLLWKHPERDPQKEACAYVNPQKNVADADAALRGAGHILMEHFSENADLLGALRSYIWREGFIRARLARGKQAQGTKFSDYFKHQERLRDLPSHRALAMLRGANQGMLKIVVVPDRSQLEQGNRPNHCEQRVARRFHIGDRGRPGDPWLLQTARAAWKTKILPHLTSELLGRVRQAAEREAIEVFAKNLKDLLMAAPAGPRTILGLDPGLRTGVKAAVIDDTGKPLTHETLYPHQPRNQWRDALARLAHLCRTHRVNLIAIGNGTASRETDRLAAELIAAEPDLGLQKIIVSEAGASVYSASKLAAEEFPDLDVTFRGAVSIARRLQDPLAELVKIDPKSIGVGQYQHDLNQTRLARSLDAVVEDCVNGIGVVLNTASVSLLAHVSGLNQGLAGNIVAFRDMHGRFTDRSRLMKVPRLGPKAFELAAGFLRIPAGNNPLDASAVHPEAYPVAERIAAKAGKSLPELIGNREFLKRLDPADYTDARFGIPTVTDILAELEKPGRDPRPAFQTAHFREGVETLADLEPGMVLEGVVTNVTNFGAFLDIGVHQDGLVHISALADRYIKDPHELVKTGDIVKVRVLEIDRPRRRIALSMKDL